MDTGTISSDNAPMLGGGMPGVYPWIDERSDDLSIKAGSHVNELNSREVFEVLVKPMAYPSENPYHCGFASPVHQYLQRIAQQKTGLSYGYLMAEKMLLGAPKATKTFTNGNFASSSSNSIRDIGPRWCNLVNQEKLD